MTDDIHAGSVSVDVVPDARGFSEKLRAQLGKTAVQVTANLDDKDAAARLDDLGRRRDASIIAKVQGWQEADRKLQETARKRTAEIKAKADTKGAEKNLSNLTAAIVGLGPALVPITAAVGGLAAALAAPIAAAGTGLTVYGFIAGKAVAQTEKQQKQLTELHKKVVAARAALQATVSSAGVSQTNSNAAAQQSAALSLQSAQQSAARSIASAQASLATAKTPAARAAAEQRLAAAQSALHSRQAAIAQSLANHQASTAASVAARQAAAQRKLNEALKAYHSALGGLSPAQKKFLDAQAGLKSAFKGLIDKSGNYVLGPLTQGMKDLTGLLPTAAPLLKSTSGALETLLGDLDKSARSGSLRQFLGFVDDLAGSAILGAGRALGNIGSGIAGLVQASAPLSGGVGRAIATMTSDFAHWGQNAGSNNFQDFLGYVRKEGPQVARLLGDTAGALGAIARDAAPVGGVTIKILDGLARVLHSLADSNAGPPLIAAAAGFVALKKGLQLGRAVKDASVITNLLKLAKGGGGASIASRLKGLLGLGEDIAGGGLKLGKGVVPVYVTNKGFGGPGDGILGDAEKVGGGVAAGLGITVGTATIGAAAVYFGAKYGSNKGQVDSNKAPNYIHHQVGKDYVGSPYGSRGYVGGTYVPPAIRGQGYYGPDTPPGLRQAANQTLDSVQGVKRAIADFRQELNKLPHKLEVAVRLGGMSLAEAQLIQFQRRFQELNGRVATTTIRTQYERQFVKGQHLVGGGHVLYANGGTVAGIRRPYADKVLTGLAPGEEVISNRYGQADRWRPLLKAINSGGMAGGGTVGGARGLALQQEIRGTLRLDRDGVAYIDGVARAAVGAGDAYRQQQTRLAALDGLPR